MRKRDATITRAELEVLELVWLGGAAGADLSDATRPAYGQVESRTAKRLVKAGLLTVDAGAAAHLTEAGARYVRHPGTQG
jgi:hypothetical protein